MRYLLVDPKMPLNFLYDYATVDYQDAVCMVVKVESDNPDYHANYQLGRIASGPYTLSREVFASRYDALHSRDANWTYEDYGRKKAKEVADAPAK